MNRVSFTSALALGITFADIEKNLKRINFFLILLFSSFHRSLWFLPSRSFYLQIWRPFGEFIIIYKSALAVDTVDSSVLCWQT